MRSSLLLSGALCVTLLAALPAGAGTKAWLDSNEVAAGESVRLILEHDGQSGSQPDLAPLSKDFDVVDSSTSSNVQIVNGRMSSGTQLQLTLSPKHTGQLVIPPLNWGGERTTPLTVIVSGGGSGQGATGGASAPAKAFIEIETEPKTPYVLSAVRLTVRVYEAVQLYRESLELPASNDALVRQLGNEEESSAEKNGVTYVVKTRHYLLFPQHSGKLTVAGITLNALAEVSAPRGDPNDPFSMLGGMLRNVRPMRLHSDPITLDVQPRPAAAASAPYWLPARSVNLETHWQPDTLQAHAGDPISLNLSIRALGLTAAQLPDLSKLLTIPGSLRVYPEQAKLNDASEADSVLGSREQTIAVIADQPGNYTIPALHVSWWDTQANQPRELSVPAATLQILPALAGAPGASAAAPAVSAPALVATAGPRAAQNNPLATARPAVGGAALMWQLVSATLLALWLATAGAWAWSRRRPAPPTRERAPEARVSSSRERAAFREACRHHDAAGARRHLLAWAREVYAADPPAGLSALARHLPDPSITPLLQELDRACFAGHADSAWDGEALARALTDLPAERGAARRPEALAPLYPNS